MDYRAFGCEYKADTGSRRFSGYASVFGTVDSYGDRVMPGAFAETLQQASASGRMPAMLWQHNATQPIGRWTVMREDSKGLFVEGELADTQLGRETYALLKMGAMSGLSIGFSIPDGGTRAATHEHVRELARVNLWEVSPVTFPANVDARVEDVKTGSQMTLREFEKFLRDAGKFSRAQAEAIAIRGFKGSRDEGAATDADGWMQDVIARFRA